MNRFIYNWFKRLGFIVLLLQFGLIQAETIPPVSGRTLEVNSILPADVLARSKLLIDELQMIRREMGKPEKQYQAIEVVNAVPREVYFQALALFNKANRLALEQTGYTEQVPKQVDAALIRPYHVWLMMDHALQRVLAAKTALKIPELTKETVQPIDTRPDHVYSSTVDANRLINQLLIRHFSPSDVYQQVTESIYTMAQLLASFKDLERVPKAHAFERHKTPPDVYQRLLNCGRILSKIAALSHNRVLEFKNMDNISRDQKPSDVYDLSVLLLADISHFHSLRKTAKPAAKVYYPGLKLPSHVYQRASILKQQLETLLTAVEKNPDWLSQ